MFGDDGGSLTIIRFSQPPNSLFKKDEVDNVQTLFWSNMEKHVEFAQVQYSQVNQSIQSLTMKFSFSMIHSTIWILLLDKINL